MRRDLHHRILTGTTTEKDANTYKRDAQYNSLWRSIATMGTLQIGIVFTLLGCIIALSIIFLTGSQP